MRLQDLKTVEGMSCSIEEHRFLYGFVSLIKPKLIFEVGTHTGISAISMGLALRDGGLSTSKIVSADTNETYLRIAQEQINMFKLTDYIELKHGDSSLAKKYPSIDFAFIDGNHDYEYCKKDFENLKKATYIVFHDSIAQKGVSKLMEEISQSQKYTIINLVSRAGMAIVVRK